MKNIRLLFFVFMCVAVVVAGCASKRPPAQYGPSQIVHDTITVTNTVTLRDTVLVSPPASTGFQTDLNNVKDGYKQETKSKNATAAASVENGKLNVSCTCDSLEIYAQLRDKFGVVQRTKTVTITNPPEKIYEKYVPWYVKFLAWCGGVSLVVLGGAFILYKLKILK